MQLPVRVSPELGNGWALLDLQGTLESNVDDIQGLPIGQVTAGPKVRDDGKRGPWHF